MAMRSWGFQLLTGVKVGTCGNWGEEEGDIVTVPTVVEISFSLGTTSRCMTNVTSEKMAKERNLVLEFMSMVDFTCSLLCDKPLIGWVLPPPEPLHYPSYQM